MAVSLLPDIVERYDVSVVKSAPVFIWLMVIYWPFIFFLVTVT
jgi:hypothetical protein